MQGSSEILETVVSDTEEVPSRPLKLSKTAEQQEKKIKTKAGIAVEHTDIIKNEFWQRRPWILSGRAGKLKVRPNVPMSSPGDSINGGSEEVVGVQRFAVGQIV
jgi:hypothetical protein